MKEFEFNKLKERLNFSYNGDLGALQHKTAANIEKIDMLEDLGQITYEQYEELKALIIDYFTKELQAAINSPLSYVR